MKTITDPKTGTTTAVMTATERTKLAGVVDILSRFLWFESGGGPTDKEGSNAQHARTGADSIRKLLAATKPAEKKTDEEPET